MDRKAADVFIENWGVYQKLVGHNYMLHGNFMALIREHLFNEKDALKVLDLGCGDASQILPLLRELPVAAYTGFDLSAPALEFAKKNLEVLDGEIRLQEGPMELSIQEVKGSYDIIFSSYAIHHLQDEQKKELLIRIASLLENNGKFIWIDVFRKDGQSRQEYLDQYVSMIASTWTELNEAEQALIFDHITHYDFPAEISPAIQWLQEAGFAIQISDTTDRFHKVFILGHDKK